MDLAWALPGVGVQVRVSCHQVLSHCPSTFFPTPPRPCPTLPLHAGHPQDPVGPTVPPRPPPCMQVIRKVKAELPQQSLCVEYTGALQQCGSLKLLATVTAPTSWNAAQSLYVYEKC